MLGVQMRETHSSEVRPAVPAACVLQQYHLVGLLTMLCPALLLLAAMRAVNEIKSKQREDYSRLTVLGDTLAFEADHP